MLAVMGERRFDLCLQLFKLPVCSLAGRSPPALGYALCGLG